MVMLLTVENFEEGEYVLAIGLDEQVLPGVITPGQSKREAVKGKGQQAVREGESVREDAARLADESGRVRDRETGRGGWRTDAFDL
jgi:hypothetical protein